MNLRHVVVTDGGRVTVVPIYRDAAPGFPSDCSLVFHIVVPENAVSRLQLSRFFTGHSIGPCAQYVATKPFSSPEGRPNRRSLAQGTGADLTGLFDPRRPPLKIAAT
jgi:hypothetical protein